MYVIAISNEKGGSGKSTTAANIGAALAERGHRTLLVDLDPSSGLTRMLGVLPEHFEFTLLDVLRQPPALPRCTRPGRQRANRRARPARRFAIRRDERHPSPAGLGRAPNDP